MRLDVSRRVDRPVAQMTLAERLNFLLTNRIPRIPLTHAVGWLSRIEHPWVAAASIAVWRAFVDDLRLFEARDDRFRSLGHCFTRALRPGARPVDPDPDVLVSPCDAVIGASGRVRGGQVYQAKGFPYTLEDLFGQNSAGAERARFHRDSTFVTLRLKSSMYHRLHAPEAGRLGDITYISGDTWNVNPVALKRVERLYCKNERVVFDLTGETGQVITLVAVAAVLVASVHIRGLDRTLNLRYRGPNHIPFDRPVRRGEEIGHFEQGSTVVLFAPAPWRLAGGLACGQVVRMGQPLLARSRVSEAGGNGDPAPGAVPVMTSGEPSSGHRSDIES